MSDALSGSPVASARLEPLAGRRSRLLAARAVAVLALLGTLIAVVFHHHAADYTILHAVNARPLRAPLLIELAVALTHDAFSTFWLVTLVGVAWFQFAEADSRARILVGVVTGVLAGILSRVLQHVLPTHVRPLHDPDLGFIVPQGINPGTLNHWGSFPSDHAAVFFGLATTVILVNRRLGWVAMVIATICIAARVFLGYHFPTDVLGGALIGYLAVDLAQPLRNSRLCRCTLAFEQSHRAWFYAIAIYLCFGVATLFDDLREVASSLAHLGHS